MFLRSIQFLKLGTLVWGTVLPLLGGNFTPPAEGPLPFRRDRVPLEADIMMDLSLRISMVADGLTGENAWERRSAAQLLALSLALDPVNTGARDLLREFAREKHRAAKNPQKVQENRDRIKELLVWLDTSDAGKDGQALAACLKDVVAISEVIDESRKIPEKSKESGMWAEWIPEMAKYEDEPVAVVVDFQPPDESGKSKKPEIPLASAKVTVPLWRENAKSSPPSWEMVLSELKMTAAESLEYQSGKPHFDLTIGDATKNPRSAATRVPILKLLRKLHQNLPESMKVTILSSEIEATQPKSRPQPMSAAAAVLASAAITGREPVGTILGEVDEEGNYTLPSGYWLQLRSLASGNASRVILPEAAAADLPSLLAMEKSRFFMDHEILLAKDFSELLKLSAAKPDAATEAVFASFREIRGKVGTLGLGPYLATSAVRKRLAELAQAAPYHYSARMLAIQGAGDRPIYINRKVLIAELQQALEPMDWLVKRGREPLTPVEVERLGTTFESCRSRVDELHRYTERADRAPVEKVLEMLNLIRALDRASRSRADSSGNNIPQQTAYSAFIKSAKETLGLLDPASAETEQ